MIDDVCLCRIISGLAGLGILFLLFGTKTAHNYGDTYYTELYCSKCGKCSEQLLLWGHEANNLSIVVFVACTCAKNALVVDK